MYQIRFPRRIWLPDEYKHWLAPGYPKDPPELIAWWRQKGPMHFMPPQREELAPVLKNLGGSEAINCLEAEAVDISKGWFRYFFKEKCNLGFPPDWHRNPIVGNRAPRNLHWSRIPVQSKQFGDIKYIWEPGRFASAYILARAYRAAKNEIYADYFWQLIESWGRSNPPNHGSHWRCGQEISIRLMAWVFALYVFKDSPLTTPQRFAELLGMIAVQADRVAGTTLYSYLQNNNHSISEGAALWTVGVLFPMLAKSDNWMRLGRKLLERDALRLISEDGSFSQRSNHYHRLMLHDFLYAIRIGEVNGLKLAKESLVRIQKASEFILGMIDANNGWSPNMGGNDGALIVPLNGCDYNDMRPVAAAAHYLFRKEKLFESGPWHEDLYWYFGPQALKVSVHRMEIPELNATRGGYYTLRGQQSWCMMRCSTYRERPSHADSLVFDLWRYSRNIAMDPGSYLYYGEPPWNRGFVETRHHNTVSVDNLDQLEKGPRFIWIKWHQARLLARGVTEQLCYLEGEHDGYARLKNPVIHRRSIAGLKDLVWAIIDDVYGQGIHEFALHWLLSMTEKKTDGEFEQLLYPEGPVWFSIQLLESEKNCHVFTECLEKPSEADPRGWFSRYYGFREPALSYQCTAHCEAPVRYLTIFSFTPWQQFSSSLQQISLQKQNFKLQIDLNTPGDRLGIIKRMKVFKQGKEESLQR